METPAGRGLLTLIGQRLQLVLILLQHFQGFLLLYGEFLAWGEKRKGKSLSQVPRQGCCHLPFNSREVVPSFLSSEGHLKCLHPSLDVKGQPGSLCSHCSKLLLH